MAGHLGHRILWICGSTHIWTVAPEDLGDVRSNIDQYTYMGLGLIKVILDGLTKNKLYGNFTCT